MIICRKSDYALRAVDYLARFEEARSSSEDNATTARLAKDMEIPYRFLRIIIKELCTANIVKSRRGNLGGIRLARPRDNISFFDVLKAVDAKALAVNECTLHASCSRIQVCGIHYKMAHLQHTINEQLSKIRFSDSF